LIRDGSQGKVSQQDLAKQLQSIRGRQVEAIRGQRNALNLRDNLDFAWGANWAANEFQNLELINGKEVLAMLQAETVAASEGPSLSYTLDGSVSLASRSDQQMVRVLQTSFTSSLYHVATPVLTSLVYREAELVNTSQQDLLAGPIAVYLDDRFVGRSEIPTVARGQTLVVGFGADPQLRARRELANRNEGVQGGNRELGFKYRLVVENFKETDTHVRLFDRMPHSDRAADIRIKLGETSDPLSENKLYVRIERPKNILRWDVTVAAGSTGEDVRIVEYEFTVDFDRNFAINVAGESPVQWQQDFEQQQRARLAH
jgi:uncharacterized protein (TIGR02231 family)